MRYTEFLLNRVSRMFSYDNLPVGLDGEFIARELIVHGRIGITTKGTDQSFETPRAWRGWCGGLQTAEYTGSRFIGASPVLGGVDFEIGTEGAVIFNSTEDRFNYTGADITVGKKGKIEFKNDEPLPTTALYEYIVRTADLLQNIDTSIRSLLRTSRALLMITSKNDETKNAAEIVLKKILDGETVGIFKSDLLDSLNFTFAPTAANAQQLLAELKEQYQFMLAEFYHAIGINANYNLKRERLNTAEIDVNTDALFINIIDMLKCREAGVKDINRLYGTDISVRLGDEWQKERDADSAQDDKQADDTTNAEGGAAE